MDHTTKTLKIDALTLDCGTQIRAAIDQATVERYAEAMRAGAHRQAPGPLPPVVVFHDGDKHYLADGFHRLFASREVGSRTIQCEIHAGTLADAIFHAAGANATHGLPRTNEDKRRAVEAVLLLDPKRSDRHIAVDTATSHTFVARIRASQVAPSPPGEPATRRGRDGKQYAAPEPKPAAKSRGTFAHRQEADDRTGASCDPGPVRSISSTPHVEQLACPWTGGPHDWQDGACALCHEPEPPSDEATPNVAQATPNVAHREPAAGRAAQVATLQPDDPAAEYERILAENKETALAVGVAPAQASDYFAAPTDPHPCDPRFRGYVVWDVPSRTYYTGRGSRFTDEPEHAKRYADHQPAHAKAAALRDLQARQCVVAAMYDPDETAPDRNRCPTCNGAGKILRAFPLPDELRTPEMETAWDEWLADRKARHQPITANAARRQIKFLADLGPAQAIEAINASIVHGWTGLFDPRDKHREKAPAKLANKGKTHQGKVAAL